MDNFGNGIGHSLAALMEDWDEEFLKPKKPDRSTIFDSGIDNSPPASLQSTSEFLPQQNFFDLEEEMNTVFQTRLTPPPKPPRNTKLNKAQKLLGSETQQLSRAPKLPPRLGLDGGCHGIVKEICRLSINYCFFFFAFPNQKIYSF